MQQNATTAGAPPGPHWGSLQRSPDPLAGFKGAASRRGGEGKDKEGVGMDEKGKGREGQGRRGMGWDGRLTLMRSWNSAADWLRPALATRTLATWTHGSS